MNIQIKTLCLEIFTTNQRCGYHDNLSKSTETNLTGKYYLLPES